MLTTSHRFTQLKLQPNASSNSDPEKLNYALQLERQAFQTAQSHEQYSNMIRERSKGLHATRQNANMGFQNQNQAPTMTPNNPMIANGMGFNRSAPAPQMSSQMPMVSQVSGMMGVNGPQGGTNSNMFMRQPATIGQPGPQNQAPPQMQQQNGVPNGLNRQQPLRPNDAEIDQLTMRLKTEMEQQPNAQMLRENLRQKLGPAQLQTLQNQGLDILHVWARKMAMQKLGYQGNQPTPLGNAQPPQNTPMTQPQNQNQNQSQPGLPPSMRASAGDQTRPSNDFAQVLAQQAAAARSQARGDPVVPASNNQNFQGQLGRGPYPPNFNGVSNNAITGGPQQPGNLANGRPPSSFQPAQIQGQGVPQPPNFGVSASPAQNQFALGQPNALTGQPGGLHMPGPSPAMPTLNQPMGAPGQQTPQRSNPGLPRSQQPSPMPGAPGNPPASIEQPSGLGRPPNGLPNLLTPSGKEWAKQHLQKLPEGQRMQFTHLIRNEMARQTQAQAANGQMGGLQQPQPGPPNGIGQPGMAPMVKGPGAPNIPQPPMSGGPNLPVLPGSGFANGPINQAALEQSMNQLPLPKDALSKRVPELDIPLGIANWAGLFDFLGRTPNSLSPESHRSLKDVRHQQFLMVQAGAQRRPPIQGPAATVQPFSNNAIFSHLPADKQNLVPDLIDLAKSNTLEANNMRQVRLRDVSQQELQMFRQNSNNDDSRASDMHVRGVIIRNKAQRVAQRFGPEFARMLLVGFSQANNVPLPHPQQAQRPLPAAPVIGQPGLPPHAAQPFFAGPTPGGPVMTPQQRQPVPGLLPGPQVQPNGMPKPSSTGPGQPQALSKDLQARMQEEMKKRPAQSSQAQPPPPTRGTEPNLPWNKMSPEQKMQRFTNLLKDIGNNTPRGPPVSVPLNPQISKLQEAIKSVLDSQQTTLKYIQAFFLTTGNESKTRELLAAIISIRNQTKPTNPPNVGPPQIEFTTSPMVVGKNAQILLAFRSSCQEEQAKKRGNEQGAPKAGAQPVPPATQSAQSRPPSQTTTKSAGAASNKGQATSNASTTQKQPSRPFGQSQPGDSVTYFNENKGLNLSIPASKVKQRMSQPPSGEAPAAPVVAKTEPDQKSGAAPPPPPKPVDLPFKCSIPGCDHEVVGFTSQQEQHTHERNVHKYAGDPMRWCLGSLKDALGLHKPAAIRKAAAARAQATEVPQQKIIAPQSVAMKRELSTQSITPQGRSTSGLGPDQRPGSALSNKRGAISVQGQSDAEVGSPSKRPRTAPAQADPWQHTEWSRELMQQVFTDISGATVLDPLIGCRVPGLDKIESSPPEAPEKNDKNEGESEDTPMSDEDHIQALLDWKDPHTEELFKDVQQDGEISPLDGGDWFMIDGNSPHEPSMSVTDEQIDEFMRNGPFDPEKAFEEAITIPNPASTNISPTDGTADSLFG